MDNELIAAIVAVLLAAAGWLKSHSEVNGVKADREKTKTERDTEIALLKQKCEILTQRLDDGQSRFDRIEGDLKEINKSLTTIITKVDMMLRRSGHTPDRESL